MARAGESQLLQEEVALVVKEQYMDDAKTDVPQQCLAAFDNARGTILVVHGVDEHVLANDHAVPPLQVSTMFSLFVDRTPVIQSRALKEGE